MELDNELKLILHLLVAKTKTQIPTRNNDEWDKGVISGYSEAVENMEGTIKEIEEL